MVVGSDCPACEPKQAEKHGEHKYEPRFGLVDPAVALRYPDDYPVIEWPGNKPANNNAHKASEMRETLFDTDVNTGDRMAG